MKILLATSAFAIVIVMLAAVTVAPVKANPGFAQQTGKPCAACHTAPPKLNAAGKKFKAKGFKL